LEEYIDIVTTWESSLTYAGKYTGGNALTYSGTTSATDSFQDSTEAPDLTLTRTATVDAPLNYSDDHWDAVPGATAYKVYSSSVPYDNFEEDNSGSFDANSWGAPLPAGETKMFYRVTASAE